jgi:hypothetical protein
MKKRNSLAENKNLEIDGNMEWNGKRKRALYLGKCVYYDLVAQEGENGEVIFVFKKGWIWEMN